MSATAAPARDARAGMRDAAGRPARPEGRHAPCASPEAQGDRPVAGIGAIAEQFPLIAEQRKRTRPLAYLDNAATTQKPACVLEAQDLFYRRYNANPLRGTYRLGREATQLYDSARRVVARFLGCDDDEIVFTGGATDSLNTAAYAYGLRALSAGDDVVLPVSEHHSSLIPWQTVADLTGANLVYVLPDEQGRFNEEAWERAIGPRTKIVAVAHVSNVLGNVAPLDRIARMAHGAGAVVVADCAQSVAHLPVDVRALDVDFAAFSGHKVYAPMGIGVLYGKRGLLERMAPLRRGGGMVDAVFERRSSFADAPQRFEAGTPNVEGAVGLAEAIRFVEAIGFDTVFDHEDRLLARMLDGLAAIPDVSVYGEPDTRGRSAWSRRCGVVSFNVRGTSALDVGEALSRSNVAVRAGAHCAEPLVRHLGQRAVCRASLALYNTEDDVDRFLEAVEAAKRTVAFMIMAGIH